jgi:UDP-GlcNAc:undecaprenyl-phosphate GlcNAc-1-phosphate transferase
MAIGWQHAVAFGVALALCVALIPLAQRIGLVDRPGERKKHEGAIPLVGGIALYAGFAFGLLVSDVPLGPFRDFLTASLLIVIAGVLDDFHEWSARARFAAQILACLVVAAWGGIQLTNLGALFTRTDSIYLGWWSIPFTVFAITGVINALNMIDGRDGLAGGIALLTLVALAFVATVAGQPREALLLGLVAAATLGFLGLNLRRPGLPRARVFLGDAGSMFLGLAIGYFAVRLSQAPGGAAMKPVTGLWLFALPILDTLYVIWHRLRAGRSPFRAGHEHLHDLLGELGLSYAMTLFAMLGLSAIGVAIGLSGHLFRWLEHWQFAGFVALGVVHFLASTAGWTLVDRRRAREAAARAMERIL